jgi:hypothetical protein
VGEKLLWDIARKAMVGRDNEIKLLFKNINSN